jgi:hypothetical protein
MRRETRLTKPKRMKRPYSEVNESGDPVGDERGVLERGIVIFLRTGTNSSP